MAVSGAVGGKGFSEPGTLERLIDSNSLCSVIYITFCKSLIGTKKHVFSVVYTVRYVARKPMSWIIVLAHCIVNRFILSV